MYACTAIRKDAGLCCGSRLRKGEVFAHVGLPQNLKDLKARSRPHSGLQRHFLNKPEVGMIHAAVGNYRGNRLADSEVWTLMIHRFKARKASEFCRSYFLEDRARSPSVLDQHRLPPRQKELARFGDEKSANISRGGMSSRVVQLENGTNPHPTHRVTILPNWQPKLSFCVEGTRALYALRLPLHQLSEIRLWSEYGPHTARSPNSMKSRTTASGFV